MSEIASDTVELFKAQHGQDRFVYERFFKSLDRPGTYFEAGMVAGIDISNSYFFEKALGWNGICVEANPWYFDFVRQRRSAQCFNVALGSEEGEVLFLGAEYIGGILKYMDRQHIERIERGYIGKKDKAALTWVRCTSVMNVFAEAGVDEIDFFSLDIEGGEMHVLRTIDFNRVRINVAAVESQYGVSAELHALFTANGFEFVQRVGGDEVFAHRDFLAGK